MKLPKISIITPSYNQGEFIQTTIKSVLNQGYPNLEYIIMDGMSTDNTIDILRSYDGQLIWFSESDKGQSHAINKGIQRASGDIITFLNSDDFYLPGALMNVAKEFMKNPDLIWLTGNYKIVDNNNLNIQPFVVKYKQLLRYFPGKLKFKVTNFIAQPSTFWKRSIHEVIGTLDTTLRYAFDYDFWLRLLEYQKPAVINEYLSVFRLHPNSKSGSEFEMQFNEELEVLKRRGCTKFEYHLHRIHNQLIVSIYKKIK